MCPVREDADGGGTPTERLHRSPLTSSRLEHPLYATFHPDRFDVTGAVVCLIGVAVIMYAPR